MQNQVAQSFLNKTNCEHWKDQNSNQVSAQSQKDRRYFKEYQLI